MKVAIIFFSLLTTFLFIASIINGCATGLGAGDTKLREYSVPINMSADSIDLQQISDTQTCRDRIPDYCFQCVFIFVNADIAKDITPQMTVPISAVP